MGTEVITKTEEAAPAEAPSAIEQQIIRQIEYYFGDYNLSRDKYLREKVTIDNGWVPLEIIVKFNRLKKLSEDFNVIIEALKKSPKQLMEISEDCTKIRRRNAPDLPEEYSKRHEELDKRTLYVKGFKKNSTLDELLDFFKDWNVEHVFMRRRFQQNKPFKGSCFVTFETREGAEKFLEKKGVKYSGTELLKEWKVDYIKRKQEQRENIKVEKEKRLLKRAGMNKEEKEDDDIDIPEIEIIPGCLLKITNLHENTTREHIKEVFAPHGNLVYIDYSRGKSEAVLRYDTGIAGSILEKLTEEDGVRKVDVASHKVVVSLIEGDEEKEYWKTIAKSRAQNRLRFKGNKSSGNKGRFRQRSRKQKGKRNNDEDNDEEIADHPNKKIKVEDSEDKDEPVKMETCSETKEKEEFDDHHKKKVKVKDSENKDESTKMETCSETKEKEKFADHPKKKVKDFEDKDEFVKMEISSETKEKSISEEKEKVAEKINS